ncbi:hypothetical protein [Pediococcus claussenii]|uniref:hypothetical protein n=1 Tax=Pediococcus claussenii TaxID=187452 RepID=UPI00081A3A63|nr:hypothetical protein [Pediococcus claussenii]ANZ69987.1 hypothetical protein AYR57_06520 [Pediococcus claussenii]ANZ71803.1 hypothetical protein AYR58_06520 [Pediococcus claussenii]
MRFRNFFYKGVNALLNIVDGIFKYVRTHSWLRSVLLSSILLVVLLIIYGRIVMIIRGNAVISKTGIKNSLILYIIIVTLDRLLQKFKEHHRD